MTWIYLALGLIAAVFIMADLKLAARRAYARAVRRAIDISRTDDDWRNAP